MKLPLSKKEAIAKRDHLLILWLTTLPWRQRNLRECKIGPRRRANVFADVIDNAIAIPSWAKRQLARDRETPIWQFHFRPHETKTHCVAKGVLPRVLLGPLQDYLDHARPVLLASKNCSNLFLNNAGDPLSRSSMTRLVRSISFRHLGQHISPHAFRHAFAVAWLEDHPRDHTTLARILWHSTFRTTIKVYAKGFNESHGAVYIDNWLKEKKQSLDFKVGKTQSGVGEDIVEEAIRHRDGLLFLWMITLPWKAHIFRECRVEQKGKKDNIQKNTVGDLPRPAWVEELMAKDPGVQVWQFRFSAKQSGVGHRVNGILPERLITPLEDYLERWRPVLLGSSNCTNLFLTKSGKPMSADDIRSTVGVATLRTLGKWLTPSSFRDAFADEWLRCYPNDYLVLSKILWHSDPASTIARYGKNLDISDAVVAVDKWIQARADHKSLEFSR